MTRLAGKVALITGGSRGLGRALALAFAHEGASLGICARRVRELDEVAAATRALGVDVAAVGADVGSERDRELLLATVLARFGRIDILVNNASTLGLTPLPLLADTDSATFAEVIRVNLVAPFILARDVIRTMLLRGDGVVVNISSDAAVQGYPGWGAYSATKAGLDALSRVWAAELEGTGVRVYAVDPGDMDTEMHRAADPEADPSELERPEVVAEAFVELVATGSPSVRLEASAFKERAQTWLK
jgi:NAD(P)-dependent dehydrogenase (short-subunit alcohol dehydrogenase family)